MVYDAAVLTSIRIRNLALIDDIEIPLDDGLTVLTGETGAGKSIIVGALNLVLGDRASADAIRSGVDEAEVEALFELTTGAETQQRLAEMDLAEDDGAFVVRRVITRVGKNRVYLNGRLSTLGELKRMVGPLVDISSQHAHTSLLKVPEHRAILDRFGDLSTLLSAYGQAYGEWRSSAAELKALIEAEHDRVERAGFLRFQLEEIDTVEPVDGEEDDLVAERELLAHAADLREAAQSANDSLAGGRAALVDTLSDVERTLRMVSDSDPTMGALADRVESARIELDDVAMEARAYLSRVEVDPQRLEVVTERLDALRKLMRSYGPELSDVLARRQRIAEELETLDFYEDRVAARQTQTVDLRQSAERAARALSDARKTTARKATKAVEAQLADLGMAGSRFEVAVEPADELTPVGGDRVEFLLSSNVGEKTLPLARIASGGELSRIMLALKHVLAAADTVDCYVFDEVDTGVSGAIADRIGVKLHETASQRQALCITHLAQVACHADQQLRVHKQVEAGRTVTRVTRLQSGERTEEIARLLAGAEVTTQARAHAAELLAKARA